MILPTQNTGQPNYYIRLDSGVAGIETDCAWLLDAVRRETNSEIGVLYEVHEETSLDVEPVALAGNREVIARDAQGRVERHFVILCFAARWRSGEAILNEELDDARWIDPSELSGLQTTEGLAEIVTGAIGLLA